jgi:hypothetical protein
LAPKHARFCVRALLPHGESEPEMNSKIWLIAIFAMVLAPRSAEAGVVASLPVTIFATSAQGSLRDARSSANTVEGIGCTVTKGTSTSGSCQAADAAGTTRACSISSTHPNRDALLGQIQSISDSAAIAFGWDSSGACTTIMVIHTSSLLR